MLVMTLRRINLDLDGVVYDWVGLMQRECRTRFGVDLRDSIWITEHETNEKISEWYFGNPEVVFGYGEMYPGAEDGIRYIKRLTRNLTILTSAKEAAHPIKQKWLERKGIQYDEYVGVPLGELKSDYPGDLFIDDGSHVVDDIITRTYADVILVTRPWNMGEAAPQSEGSPRMRRAADWTEICHLVRERFLKGRFADGDVAGSGTDGISDSLIAGV